MVSVSVIIPYYNAGSWIKETLDSLMRQGIAGMEVILIDDGSTDGGINMAGREFPSVQIIRTANQGPVKARNLGTRLSKGKFIQYLDADDVLASGKLKAQVEILESSGADVAYGDWQRMVGDRQGKYALGEEIRREIQDAEIDLFTDFWCPPAVYLFRRSIIEKVGGFRESLPIIQDARFALDCALYGGRFVYCPGIMAYYRMHSTDSVSSRDPVGFNRDILRNAAQVEQWWQAHGGIDAKRRKALLEVYGYVARVTFEGDRETFESAYKVLNTLMPGYIPEKPRRVRLVARVTGYRRAEEIALWYRRAKRILRGTT